MGKNLQFATVLLKLHCGAQGSLSSSQLIVIYIFFAAGAQPRTNGAFGQGTGDIFLDNVVCDGNELRLVDCASNPLAAHNCQHSQDAGVACQPATSREYSLYL